MIEIQSWTIPISAPLAPRIFRREDGIIAAGSSNQEVAFSRDIVAQTSWRSLFVL